MPRCFVPLCLLVALAAPLPADEFPQPKNTQKDGEHPPTAAEAAAKITVPKGFNVTLFAGEPDVQNPIAFDIDDRGRLWVVENYTYTGRGFTDEFRDRIIILHDKDQDGKADERKVFWDAGRHTSAITLGFGGAWVCNDGKLIHIPDKDGDDKPDGEPTVLLDGFEHDKVAHNVVNGLMWGPDGWLYGRHGIQALSTVGKPGTPQEKRTKLRCGIWRFHPTRHTFEVVAHGTTNPWGMDYNEHGEFFFTNNVIGHLWHVVPGAHYKRMYGEDFNPHVYELIDQTADHFHWDTKLEWHQAREVKGGKTDTAGGGHSHCGGMIYLGDNWPDEYRGKMFMCNTHGRRVNMDILARKGNGYTAKHGKDFLFANQPWFRGVELKYGPDGGVYLSDWADEGECHDADGVHRLSGRIYKITYGEVKKVGKFDVSKMTDAELIKLQLHKNAWWARHARRVLQERAVTRKRFDFGDFDIEEMSVPQQLRMMWTVRVMGEAANDIKPGFTALHDENEHIRVSWIYEVIDGMSRDESLQDLGIGVLRELAETDQSGLVRLHVASALQKVPVEDRWELATALSQREEDVNDPVQPLMIWYGIEPAVAANRAKALELAKATKMPKLRTFIARRLAAVKPDAEK